MTQYKDIMLDLETYGTRPTSVIMSIGAVAFNLEDEDTIEGLLGSPVYGFLHSKARLFHENVDPAGQQEFYGRTIDTDTLDFWMDQPRDTALALRAHRIPLNDALSAFSAFTRHHGAERLWGFGAAFDNVLIESAARATKTQLPFTYRGHYCMRTLVGLFMPGKPEFPGKEKLKSHVSLHDAIFQVVWAQQAWKKARVSEQQLSDVVEGMATDNEFLRVENRKLRDRLQKVQGIVNVHEHGGKIAMTIPVAK